MHSSQMYTVGPGDQLLDLASGSFHRRSTRGSASSSRFFIRLRPPFGRAGQFAPPPLADLLRCVVAMTHDAVDQLRTPERLLPRHMVVALGIAARSASTSLARCARAEQLVHALRGACRISFGPGCRCRSPDPGSRRASAGGSCTARVRERHALVRGRPRQAAMRPSTPPGPRQMVAHVGPHVLHRVVDREAGRSPSRPAS